MRGDAKHVIRFLEGADKQFIIPAYQRNYQWKVEQCQQLFDDLVKTIEQKRENHFFGSIVSTFHPEGAAQEYFIIDGQQRITTISLLLLAMVHLLEQGIVTSKDKKLSQKLYEEYLIDKYQPERTKLKLKPVAQDRKAFSLLFDGKKALLESSHITANYQYFRERITKGELDIDNLYEAVSRLMVIEIIVTEKENPQLIFESLNATGVALEEGDKVRNYLLMGLPFRKQTLYYTKYWQEIESCTDYDIGGFLREYLRIQLQSTPPIGKVAVVFKKYVEEHNRKIEPLLQELEDYAHCYEKLMACKTPSSSINAVLKRLQKLEFHGTKHFLLEVLRLWQLGSLTEKTYLSVCRTLEIYLFRRGICGLPVASSHKVFLTLHQDILQLDDTLENYDEKLKYLLLNKEERQSFPEDREFIENFTRRNMYTVSGKMKQYIFERLENKNHLETKDVYDFLEKGICSIEHIMPQKLTEEWKIALGEDWERIQQVWLHRLANLTLTAYNSVYSNKSFLEKRDLKDVGLKESGFRINQALAQKNAWTEKELMERNEGLAKEAIEIWYFPKTNYQPKEMPLLQCSLEEEDIFVGKEIVKFRFCGVEQPVKNWSEMYQKVLSMLHEVDKTILNQLADRKGNKDLSQYVGREKEDFPQKNCCQIAERIYVVASPSVQHKLAVLKQFFHCYQIDISELTFFWKEESIEYEV